MQSLPRCRVWDTSAGMWHCGQMKPFDRFGFRPPRCFPSPTGDDAMRNFSTWCSTLGFHSVALPMTWVPHRPAAFAKGAPGFGGPGALAFSRT